MEAVGEPQNVNVELRISRKNILELSDENVIEGNDEVKILHISNCENLVEAQEKILSLNFLKFPKVFVILIKLLNEREDDDIDELQEIILSKFTDSSRPLLVELSSVNFTEFYYKRRNVDGFSSVSLDFPKLMLKEKIDKGGLTCDALLLIMKSSLLDADLYKVFEYFLESEIHPLMHAINTGDELCYRLIDLFDLNLFEEFKDKILLHTVEFKKFDFLLAFFDAFNESQVTQLHINKILSLKCGVKSQNAFMMAIETKNLPLTKLLLGFSAKFPDFFNFKLLEEALNAIKKREFFEVLTDLKFSKFSLTPEEVKKKKILVLECEKLLSEISQLKSSIKGKKIDEVKDFAKNYPDLRLCYGKSEDCALELSIDIKLFDIYALLRSLGFYTDKGAEFDRKIMKLPDEERKIIRDENIKHFVSNPEAYIGIIQSKCTFEPQSPIASSDVREMLHDLNRFDEISSTYPTVAHSNVQINFDFKTKTIHVMDPLQDVSALGLAYNETGILYLALNDSKNQRYGTFAHELMHLVLHLIFENNCLPYCKGDTEREAEWTKIVEDLSEYCEKNPKTEEIIELVFRYNKCKWFIEMAVRVNDMLAFYRDNDEKIIELVGLHPELFSYMREKVLADLKIPNVYRMIKLNNDFGLIQTINDSKLQVKPTETSEILNLATEQSKQSKKVLIVTNVPQLVLSKIRNEIKGLPGNKLNLKARNLYLNPDSLVQVHLKSEFENLTKNKDVDRIVIDFQKLQEENLKIICELELELFFVISKTDSKVIEFLSKESTNYEQHAINIQWQDLTERTQEFLLEKSIKFQELVVNLSEVLFEPQISITPEMLTILCSDDEIKVNCDSKVVKLVNFIERIVQVKKKVKARDREGFEFIHEDFLFLNFISTTQSEQILIISDMAGSGKTTLLSRIHEFLTQSFPQHFIIFISLLKYVEELTEGVGDSFTDFIAKILKFDELERQIFMQKYSKGEVKILFDAFDEISPKCKQNTTKLFQLFDKNSKNQIFITTRTHLEEDLEKEMQVFAHKIKDLTKEEQVKFLEESWGNLDSDLVKKCANLLVDKISEIISSKPSVIGVPLIVQGLAEAFKGKIDENFEREIQNLDIISVYEKIVETSFDILSSRFPQKPIENQKKTMSLPQAHQCLAICLLFSEEFANSLGLNHDEDEWPHEELARFGLIKYDKDGKFHFNHQTNAEYFIALFVFHLLKTVKKLSPVQLDFIFQVLTDEKFQVTRMFLDSMLNRVEKVQDLKSFNSSHEICEKVKNEENFLDFCAREKLFNIFEFFALAVKKCDTKLFKEVIEHKNKTNDWLYSKEEEANLMKILPHATNLTKFENFLDEILSFYSGNVCDDFLLKTHKYGDTIFHNFAAYCKSSEVFEYFWNKIENMVEDEEKLKHFLLMEGDLARIALMYSITRRNENSFYFFFEQVYCKLFNIKEFAYETDAEGENLLHHLAERGSVSMLRTAFKNLKNEFSHEEFQNFVKLKNKFGKNLFHCAALHNKSEKSVEFLVNFIKNEFGSEEFKKMLSELDDLKSLPLHCAVTINNLKSFECFFSLYEQNFSPVQMLEFLYVKDENFLHYAASHAKSKEVFEFAWTKIESLIEDKGKLKEFLLLKGRLWGNALQQSIAHLNENTFYFLFEQVFCKFFNIKDFAYKIDVDGENLLHFLAERGLVSMFKFVIEKLKNEFSPEDFQNFVKFRSKNRKNFLHCAARNKIERSVEFLVDFITNEVSSSEFKEMLSELDDLKHLPLHWAAKCFNSKVFEIFFSLFEKFFTFDEIKRFLTSSTNRYYENVFTLMRETNKTFQKPEHSEWNKMLNETNIKANSAVEITEDSARFMKKSIKNLAMLLADPYSDETGEDGENILQFFTESNAIPMLTIALDKLNTKFPPEDPKNWSQRKKLVDFLDNFNKYEYSNEEIIDMLSKLDDSRNLQRADQDNNLEDFLHQAVKNAQNSAFFEFAWKRTVNLIQDKNKRKELLLTKGSCEKNALLQSIANQNERNFCFLFKKVFCKFFNIKDFAYETDEFGQNLLHFLARYGSVLMLKTALKKLKTEFAPEELQDFVKLKNKYDKNLLHCAAHNENEKSVEFLMDFIENEVGSDEIIKMLNELDSSKGLPLIYAVKFNNLKVSKFFFELYERKFSQVQVLQFLSAKDENGNNFLHRAAAFSKSKEVFEFVWMKIEKLYEDKEKLKEFLLVKGKYEKNSLLWSIADQNANIFGFLFEQVFCKFLNIKEFAYETDEDGQNILHCLARCGSDSMLKFALGKIKNEFAPEELQNFVKGKCKNGLNLLHYTACNGNVKSVEFFANFIENEVGSKEFKKMLSELDDFKSLPLHWAAQFNNLKVFECFFSLYEQNFSPVQMLEFLRAKDGNGDNFLPNAALSKSKEVFECFWINIVNLFEDKEKLKELLLKKRSERNALMWFISGQNENNFCFFLEQVFCKIFDIKDFAYETDAEGGNFLHLLARYGSVPMLKFALEKLKNEFSPGDFQNFIKIKSKIGYNLLHLAALNESQSSVEFLVDFIENEIGSDEVKIMLSELDILKHLPLHCAVEFNNLKVFEFFFALYEKFFNFDELISLFTSTDCWNKNIFTLMHKTNKTFQNPEHSVWQEILNEAYINIEIEADSDIDE